VIRHTLQSFTGVEHRIEKVRLLDGVTYINDSKGTNVDSTVKAVQSMKAPTVIILGGYDKHTDFSPLCAEIASTKWIEQVVVIGETATQIVKALAAAGYHRVTQAYSMEDAVFKARKLAVSGGNVLLSPACASFDMFRDYEQRGQIFKEIVNALQ
jgi:UDP-N-acetylmuramoylalanine--D-glutamate ligase